MSENSLTKTAYYLKALRDDKSIDLQELVINARKKHNTVDKSEKPLAGGDTLRIQHFKNPDNNPTFLHIAKYTPGQKASTIGRKADKEEEDEQNKAAGKDREFKTGDSFLLINKNNVVFCSSGITLNQTLQYLNIITAQEFQTKDKIIPINLIPAANISKMKLIQSQGIKEISFYACAYKLAVPKSEKRGFAKIPEALSNALVAYVSKDKSASELKAQEDIIVGTTIKLHGASRASFESKALINMAAELILRETDDSMDNFLLTTLADEIITPSQIRLQTKIKVDKEGDSVNYLSVWRSLISYMNELKSGELLEQ